MLSKLKSAIERMVLPPREMSLADAFPLDSIVDDVILCRNGAAARCLTVDFGAATDIQAAFQSRLDWLRALATQKADVRIYQRAGDAGAVVALVCKGAEASEARERLHTAVWHTEDHLKQFAPAPMSADSLLRFWGLRASPLSKPVGNPDHLASLAQDTVDYMENGVLRLAQGERQILCAIHGLRRVPDLVTREMLAEVRALDAPIFLEHRLVPHQINDIAAYRLNFVVYGQDETELANLWAPVTTILARHGAVTHREDVGLMLSWLVGFPGVDEIAPPMTVYMPGAAALLG